MNRLHPVRLIAVIFLSGAALVFAATSGPRDHVSVAAAAFRVDVVYKLPVIGSSDGPLFFAPRSSAGVPLAAEAALGSFTTARVIRGSDAEPASLAAAIFIRSDGAVEWRALDMPGQSAERAPFGDVGALVLGADRTVYRGQGGTVIRTARNGRVLRTFNVPPPRPGVPTLDGRPVKIRLSPEAVRVAALIVAPDGRLYAFADNSVNASLFDLTNGRRLDLPGYGHVLAASIATDGRAYALMFDPSGSRNPYVVGRFDLATLTLSGVVATGLVPGDGDIDDRAEMVATRDGMIWVYASQAAINGTRRSRLFGIDQALSVDEHALGSNLGSRIAVGIDDALYIYGGTGRNVIHQYDPVARRVQRSPVVAPEGSFILAVFVR